MNSFVASVSRRLVRHAPACVTLAELVGSILGEEDHRKELLDYLYDAGIPVIDLRSVEFACRKNASMHGEHYFWMPLRQQDTGTFPYYVNPSADVCTGELYGYILNGDLYPRLPPYHISETVQKIEKQCPRAAFFATYFDGAQHSYLGCMPNGSAPPGEWPFLVVDMWSDY